MEIDSRGLVRWTRNGHLVDTAPNMWKDALNERGIVLGGPEDRDGEQRLWCKAGKVGSGAQCD